MNPIKAALLVFAIYSSSALADYKPSTSSEMVVETITVNANGSNTSYYEDMTRIDTQKGVDSDSQQDISYNSKTETVKILEAWTSPNNVDIFQCPICCCSN